MAELVDALVSGTSAERRGGSSPLLGTISMRDGHSRYMTIKVYKGDFPPRSNSGPRLRSTRRRWASIPCATSCASCNCRRATATRISFSSTERRYEAPRLKAMLGDPAHPQDFPLCALRCGDAEAPSRRRNASSLYCTKIASRLTRTYTDRHGLKDLIKELLGIDYQQAAAEFRLGRARTIGCPKAICRAGCALSSRDQGATRPNAASAKDGGTARRPVSIS